ncbi:MAG: glycosyltransferase 61 family protein [Phycisphaerales bacterium JB047]
MVHKELHIPEQTVPENWVVGPRSKLLDVWSPSPLIMLAPRFCYNDHSVDFTLTHETSTASTNKARRHLFRNTDKASPIQTSESEIIYDCRFDTSDNVAHVLQNQIGVALHALRTLEIENRWEDLKFVIHEQTATYAVELFRTLGFDPIATNAPVVGNSIQMKPKKFPFRPIAADSLRPHAVKIGLLSERDAPREPVFLSRQGRRSLTNLDQIEPILNKSEYRTLYPEKLPPAEQIRSIACASHVFGLHGAALGYMMLRDPKIGGTIIESFSSQYATNWGRSIAHKVGMKWTGCIAKADHGLPHKPSTANPREGESKSYELHPDSVKIAISASKGPSPLAQLIEATSIKI